MNLNMKYSSSKDKIPREISVVLTFRQLQFDRFFGCIKLFKTHLFIQYTFGCLKKK